MKAKQIIILVWYEQGMHIQNWMKIIQWWLSESKFIRIVNYIFSWQSYIKDEMKSSNTKLVITQKSLVFSIPII